MKTDKLVGANISFVGDLPEPKILFQGRGSGSGYLRVAEKLTLGIPPGLEVHGNPTCSMTLLEEACDERRFLYWTTSRWCVVISGPSQMSFRS